MFEAHAGRQRRTYYSLIRRRPGDSWSDVKMHGRHWETFDPAELKRARAQLKAAGYETKVRTRTV